MQKYTYYTEWFNIEARNTRRLKPSGFSGLYIDLY